MEFRRAKNNLQIRQFSEPEEVQRALLHSAKWAAALIDSIWKSGTEIA